MVWKSMMIEIKWNVNCNSLFIGYDRGNQLNLLDILQSVKQNQTIYLAIKTINKLNYYQMIN